MITKTFDRPIYQRPPRIPRFRLAFRPKGRSVLVGLLIWFIAPVMLLFMLVARDGAMMVGAATSFPNPFAAHHVLMPGQPAVEGATCDEGSPREPRRLCSVFPQDDELFHLISFTEKQDGIVETLFYSESLQLGSLLEQWGEPDYTRRNPGGRTFTMIWDSPMLSASATLIPKGHEGYVRLVTVTSTTMGIH